MLITGDSRLRSQMKVVCVNVEAIQPQNTSLNNYNTIALKVSLQSDFHSLDESAGVAN